MADIFVLQTLLICIVFSLEIQNHSKTNHRISETYPLGSRLRRETESRYKTIVAIRVKWRKESYESAATEHISPKCEIRPLVRRQHRVIIQENCVFQNIPFLVTEDYLAELMDLRSRTLEEIRLVV